MRLTYNYALLLLYEHLLYRFLSLFFSLSPTLSYSFSPFASFSFSPLVLDSPNYPPGYIFSGFYELWSGEGEAPFSHLESNRGPLSKKLISLNIILGASGSRRALTDPSVHPHPRPLLTAAKPSCLSPILRFCTANSIPLAPPPLDPLQPLRSFSLPPVSSPLLYP